MICANKECSKNFEAKTHNQKYCSDECCRIATNRRIMEKYYEKKAIKNGLSRVCNTCGSKLSRYNSYSTCLSCEKKKNSNNKKQILEMLNDIS